ncbi:hypothetical protein [Sphingobium yanoikuyae]|uniref:hypothetical protein n=1 Tax=Sphingobium yanoikuyae TaxID=13690 RepID=UPI0028A96918|nr:hypothetical protein [Sphingobium yanoikuyae]
MTTEPLHDVRMEVAKAHELIRVVKHDLNNDRQAQVNFERHLERMEKKQDKFDERIEKLEEKLAGKIEENHKVISDKVDALKDSLAAVNLKQEKSAGFYAGVIAAATLAVSIILFLVKLLFERGH